MAELRIDHRPGRLLCVLAAVVALVLGLGGPVGRAHLPLLTGAAPAGSAAASSAVLDPRIARLRSGARLEVIVQFGSGVTTRQARADVAADGGRVVGELHIIPALAVRLTATQARTLARQPGVTSVSLNASVHPSGGPGSTSYTGETDTFTQSVNAPALWRAGGTGAGVGVAVIDTGIDGNLPDFAGGPEGGSRVIATAATNRDAQTADDSYGHGTDVAGIIAGDSAQRPAGDPLRGTFVGVAPEANLISVKVADEQGNASVLDVIYGLQFAVDFQHRYGIRVINLSLDATAAQSYLRDPLDAAVESAWRHGLVVVVAAGNRGTAADAVQYAPANDPFVITVGAVDEHGSSSVGVHTIADWSSRGTTQDGFAKPDVYAPGAHIVSELAPGSAFATLCPSCIVDGQYIRASGTSFAAPVVSGIVADVLGLHPAWTPDEVKGALTDPAVWTSTMPELDALAAARLSAPPEANGGLAPNRFVFGGTGEIDYTRASWSRASWSRASWSRASWSRASWSRASWSRASWSGETALDRASWSTTSWASFGG